MDGEQRVAGNPEIKDRVMAAVVGGDTETLRALIHPDFEMRQASTLPYGGVYRGVDGFLAFLDVFMATYDIEALDPVETFTAPGGAIVGELLFRGTVKGTARRIETTLLEKWEFAGGKVVRLTPHYFDPSAR